MPEQPKNPPAMEIQIKADENTMAGHYSNSARITHSVDDVVLDFMFVHGNPPFGKLLSRTILSPAHAKRLLRALAENLKRYEEIFGTIKEGPEPPAHGGYVQ
ncbi:MAG: DUF3467 domain-containing protein [Acidobacteriota bacterium]